MNPSEIKHSYRVSELISKYIELKPKGHEHWGCCPFHGEKTPSFCVQDNKRLWHCYGCGKHGDILDFVQLTHKCSLPEAAEIITGNKDAIRYDTPQNQVVDCYAGLNGIAALEKELPKPGVWFKAWNPKPTDKFPEGRFVNYKPTLVHPYRKAGELIGCTVRINMPDKKIVPMLRVIEKGGARTWCHLPFDKPRPLYRGDDVRQDSISPVLVVEGEKCADIARQKLGSMVVSWAGGTNAAKFSDWSPLRGRNVLIWPDADSEGLKAATEIKELARAAGAIEIKCLGWDQSQPKGWDVGDAVEKDRMSRHEIIDWMRSRLLRGEAA